MTDPNLDEILQMMSDKHRRQAIQILRQSPEGEVGFGELLDEIIQRTGEDDRRNHVAIQLYHNHLPKLASENLIGYDPDTHQVRYLPDQELEGVMDDISPQETPRISED